MARLHRDVRRPGDALEGDSPPTGVNLGDYQVLVYLSEAPTDSMRMCDLAEQLQLSPSGLTRRLDGLVKSGPSSARGPTSDRRVMMAVLTDIGFEHARGGRADPRRERAAADLRPARRPTRSTALESIFTAINAACTPIRRAPVT